MNKKIISLLTVLTSLFLATACSHTKSVTATPPPAPVQSADKEFRAAWVASVANISWPSKPGLSSAEQQAEAIALLDYLKTHHFNAVILQVRPQADALYQSNLEPWSYYLTGEQGKAPQPFYDPLQFWTEEAHDRGLELHVWLNPYRAHHPSGGKVSDQSVVKTHPSQVVFLKEGYWWLDPSLKETQDLTSRVIRDLVKRYDIDGVHFDDYFYPYPSYNGGADFPDSASYAAYQRGGGKLSRGDWRRASVNTLIERLYGEIKAEKKHVKFGLSPFGIWRPGHPPSIGGFDQYEQLYADAKLWLNKGWIDYFTPQLYWKISSIPQSFPVLLGWWSGENTYGRHLWPGISVGRDTGARTIDETVNQIMISRGMLPQSKGVVHWSISSVIKNTKLGPALLEGPYKREALVPSSPWLDAVPPAAPTLSVVTGADSVVLNWEHPDVADVFRWVVYYQYGNAWNYRILNRKDNRFVIPRQTPGQPSLSLGKVRISAVDRTGNESPFAEAAVQ